VAWAAVYQWHGMVWYGVASGVKVGFVFALCLFFLGLGYICCELVGCFRPQVTYPSLTFDHGVFACLAISSLAASIIREELCRNGMTYSQPNLDSEMYRLVYADKCNGTKWKTQHSRFALRDSIPQSFVQSYLTD
jgi:hypothetical protein